MIAAYNEQWSAEDPTVKATSTAPVGRITSLADTGRDRFRRSSFHNEFWSHSGLGAERLAVNLALSETGFASCVVQASARQDELDHRAERRFSLLVPHLIRAIAIQTRLQKLALENAVLTSLKDTRRNGLLVVDAGLRILFADQAAEALLANGAGLHLRGGRFALDDPRSQDLLLRGILACAGSYRDLAATRPVPWRRGDEAARLSVEVVPWSSVVASHDVAGARPVAILLIHDRQDQNHVPPAQGETEPPQQAVNASQRSRTRAELFAAITQDITANLGESDVSLSWLAKRHGVTPRRIRDLFYAENTSFTDYLLNARLDHAKELLTDPALANVNVATIALDCGFGDISWFHHTFRRRFGKTPTGMRKNPGHWDQ
ncbi:MAG: helix-turn-helix transcriptional regulator [Pararhodobacter sp.]|nr:helix-turn-helix transcriptional regulator [Pararhodobacter sp.]